MKSIRLSCAKSIRLLLLPGLLVIAATASAATVYVVDVTHGDDTAAGTEAAPWKTIERSLPALEPGSTLLLRGGVYAEAPLRVTSSGSEQAPIRIAAWPGERVDVTGARPRYREPVDAWELIDTTLGLYRSRAVDLPEGTWVGKVYPEDAAPYVLVPYNDRSNGAAGWDDLTSSTFTVTQGPRYVGPGVLERDGRLFLRLQPVPANALHGRVARQGTTTDPDALRVDLARAGTVFRIDASHVRLEGLVLSGAQIGVDVLGEASDVALSALVFDIPGNAVVLRDGEDRFTLRDSEIRGDFPAWVAWTDMKAGGTGQSLPAAHSRMKISGLNARDVTNVTIENNRFSDVFDGIVIAGDRLTIRGNRGRFLDDMVQLGSNSTAVQIDGNHIEGAGPSHDGNGDSASPGTIFVHHNVIDSRTAMLFGKADPEGLLRERFSGWSPNRPFPAHDLKSLGAGDPWKLYQNTVLFDGTASPAAAGFALWGENRTGVPHAIYNNIFIETGGGVFAHKLIADSAQQILDGNLYWRSATGHEGAPLLSAFTSDAELIRFTSLDAFRGSAIWAATTAGYPAGWETHGVQGDPGLNEDLRPSADGPAAAAGMRVPMHWPGERLDVVGALPPVP